TLLNPFQQFSPCITLLQDQMKLLTATP
ncbi:unnamed protein product, partial [Allacma fusca]